MKIIKKFFTAAIIFMLAFTACGGGDDSGSDGSSSTKLRIKNESSKTIEGVVWNNVSFDSKYDGQDADILGTWTGTDGNPPYQTNIELEISNAGTWVCTFNSFYSGSLSENGTWKRNGNIINLTTSNHEKITASLSGGKLVLKIEGDVFDDYFSGTYNLTKAVEQFTPSTNIIKTVEAGSGYIFFEINSTAYRTQELVVVDKGDEVVFTFNNYTVVVEITNPGTPKTLGSL